MEKFLSSYSNKTTMKSFRRGLELFIEFSKITHKELEDKSNSEIIDVILNARKNDLTPRPDESIVDQRQRASRFEKILEVFHRWMLKPIHTINKKPNQAYSINSARANTLGILQLFRYYNMQIVLRAGSPVSQTVISTGDIVLMPEHVRAMFHVAKDLRSKLLITLGNDLGWRIGDLLSIKRNELPNLEQEPPIEWVRITTKEKQASKTCLSDTTVQLLKEYLFSFPQKPEAYLFNSNGSGAIDQETVNNRLKDLAKEANIKVGNMKLTWHCFRDMIISTAKNLSIDGDIIKLMVGKSVNKAMLPYLTGVDVKTAFLKLQEVTKINGSIMKNGSVDMIKAMGQQIADLTTRLEQIEQANKKTNEALKVLADTTPVIYALLRKDYAKAKKLIDQQKQK